MHRRLVFKIGECLDGPGPFRPQLLCQLLGTFDAAIQDLYRGTALAQAEDQRPSRSAALSSRSMR